MTDSSEPFQFRTEKIFIGNVPPSATRIELQKHFSQYGKIVDCVIMTKQDGSGRGFGFCEFEEASSVDTIMDDWENQFLNGQWVEVKRASPENALRRFKNTNIRGGHQRF